MLASDAVHQLEARALGSRSEQPDPVGLERLVEALDHLASKGRELGLGGEHLDGLPEHDHVPVVVTHAAGEDAAEPIEVAVLFHSGFASPGDQRAAALAFSRVECLISP